MTGIFEIDDYSRRRFCERDRQRLLPIGRLQHFIAVQGERFSIQVADALVVVDNQNAEHDGGGGRHKDRLARLLANGHGTLFIGSTPTMAL
jgi:hypothetical protein